MIIPVILSGGSGTRLWPLSTPEKPKQFLPLAGPDSMFQDTLKRVSDRSIYGPPVVVANQAHKHLCEAEVADIDDASLILEPSARNTAAAILLAAVSVRDRFGPDAPILVMPSDHRIGEPRKFHAAVQAGAGAAEKGWLVTFGVVPTGPETGYGYLEAGEAIADAAGTFRVTRFTEKPSRDVATAMIADGRHFWNGGIFLFRVGDLLGAAGQQAAEVLSCVTGAMERAHGSAECIRPDPGPMEHCPNISIDYAIMERADRVAMVPLEADWSDLGSWDALADVAPPLGNDEGFAVDARNCYVRSDGTRIALLGVEDLIVVASGDLVVVMRKGHSQDVRKLADALSSRS